jgi:hypothetical protein
LIIHIVIIVHNIQHQQNLLHFEPKNDLKPLFGPFLALIGPVIGPAIFLPVLQQPLDDTYCYSWSSYIESSKSDAF